MFFLFNCHNTSTLFIYYEALHTIQKMKFDEIYVSAKIWLRMQLLCKITWFILPWQCCMLYNVSFSCVLVLWFEKQLSPCIRTVIWHDECNALWHTRGAASQGAIRHIHSPEHRDLSVLFTSRTLSKVRWMRWHYPPNTGFKTRALAFRGRARYLSVRERFPQYWIFTSERGRNILFLLNKRQEWGSNPQFNFPSRQLFPLHQVV